MPLTNALLKEGRAVGERLAAFVERSPSPYHCVETVAEGLQKAGYKFVKDYTSVRKERKFYMTRNMSSLIAVQVGPKFAWDNPRSKFKIIGAHTDSPCLRLKPNSALTSKGYLQLGVVTYGGGLWRTWFDRELGLAGKVVVRSGKKAADGSDELRSHLVRIREPVCMIPSIAIHLDRPPGTEVHKERHLAPVFIAQSVNALLSGVTTGAAAAPAAASATVPACGEHHERLLHLLASTVGASPSDIVEADICLCDTTPPKVIGVGDVLMSPRLDNEASCFAGLEAFTGAPVAENECAILAVFDNEECGSQSFQGAMSTAIIAAMQAVSSQTSTSPCSPSAFASVCERSLVVSADGAHLMHPNYADKHQPQHAPIMHDGPVVKFNANQRYATSATTSAVVTSVALRAGVPLQRFAVSNESPCGTTIGPLMTCAAGIPGVDIGIGMWAMHSIRESCGTIDVHYFCELLKGMVSQALPSSVDCDSAEGVPSKIGGAAALLQKGAGGGRSRNARGKGAANTDAAAASPASGTAASASSPPSADGRKREITEAERERRKARRKANNAKKAAKARGEAPAEEGGDAA